MVEELEQGAPAIHQTYDPPTERAIEAALTDAELFVSYNVPTKAIPPLEAVLPLAPRDVTVNQRLATLYARSARYADAARACHLLADVYHELGHQVESAKYLEAARNYESRLPAPAVAVPAPAPPPPARQPVAIVEPVVAEAAIPVHDVVATVDHQPALEVDVPADQPTASVQEFSFDVPDHLLIDPQAAPVHADPPPIPVEGMSVMAAPVETPAAPVSGEVELDVSNEWEDMLTVESDGSPAMSATEVPAAPVAEPAEAAPDPALASAEKIQEAQFYISQNMWEAAKKAILDLTEIAPDAHEVSDLISAVSAGQARAAAAAAAAAASVPSSPPAKPVIVGPPAPTPPPPPIKAVAQAAPPPPPPAMEEFSVEVEPGPAPVEEFSVAAEAATSSADEFVIETASEEPVVEEVISEPPPPPPPPPLPPKKTAALALEEIFRSPTAPVQPAPAPAVPVSAPVSPAPPPRPAPPPKPQPIPVPAVAAEVIAPPRPAPAPPPVAATPVPATVTRRPAPPPVPVVPVVQAPAPPPAVPAAPEISLDDGVLDDILMVPVEVEAVEVEPPPVPVPIPAAVVPAAVQPPPVVAAPPLVVASPVVASAAAPPVVPVPAAVAPAPPPVVSAPPAVPPVEDLLEDILDVDLDLAPVAQPATASEIKTPLPEAPISHSLPEEPVAIEPEEPTTEDILTDFVSDMEKSELADFDPRAKPDSPPVAEPAMIAPPLERDDDTVFEEEEEEEAILSPPSPPPLVETFASVSGPAETGPALVALSETPVNGDMRDAESASVLTDILAELQQENVEESDTQEDPETHYNLGIAFKEMGLLDEAIGELQKVCHAMDRGTSFSQPIQAYTWLAQCLVDKGAPEAAVRWYKRALQLPRLDDGSRCAIYYDLALAYEAFGDKKSALANLMEVYGSNIDFRDVASRIKALKS
jgi:hypothetical protein